MVNPVKVLGFLDIAGEWDPSLAFVMMGALLVATPGFLFVLKRPRPMFADDFPTLNESGIDSRLVMGGLIFGCGWGLVGLCPGPAIASIAFGMPSSLIFVAALVAGMSLANSFTSALKK
tara:strand:- start:1001 stop:1357 length:357 start_codon:yes stop_codon:yes gene_type:complete